MTILTTLEQIRKYSLCEDGWEKLLKHLNKTKADDEPLKFSTILESNGISDALWCLRSLPEEYHGSIMHLAADYADRVLPLFEEKYPDDKRPREAIKAIRDFLDGKIDKVQLRKASRVAAAAAAYAAADASAYAAAAAYAAAYDAYAAARCAEQKIQGELLIKYFG